MSGATNFTVHLKQELALHVSTDTALLRAKAVQEIHCKAFSVKSAEETEISITCLGSACCLWAASLRGGLYIETLMHQYLWYPAANDLYWCKRAMHSEFSVCVYDIRSRGPNGLYRPKSFFRMSYMLWVTWVLLFWGRLIFQFGLKSLWSTYNCWTRLWNVHLTEGNWGQLAMNMLNMARVFLYIF